ncbi:MAG: RNA polymerase sigma factor (TIGR02999 family) [Candidatus Paceibacteria bacterium]|jgi:RNA polymerase sigma factor (TIGR02999 family)
MADTSKPSVELTRLLAEGAKADELLPLVYEELRSIAEGRMRRESADHTLQATALVNEAYLRLLGTNEMSWRDRRHFYAAAAESMRRVLIEHARSARSQKRGGNAQQISSCVSEVQSEMPVEDFLALDEAMQKLAQEDAAAAEVTRLRFFGGLSMTGVAETLEISERSAYREWTFARTRLHELMQSADQDER